MNRRSILTKTGKGLMEATGKTSNLSRDLRNILKEIDGKVSVSELAEKFAKMGEPKLLESLSSMEREGYLREFVGKQEEGPRAPAGRGPASQSIGDGSDLDFTAFTPAKPNAKANEDARLQAQAQQIARQAQATRAREEAAAKARAELAARAKAESDLKAKQAPEPKPFVPVIPPVAGILGAGPDAQVRAQADAQARAQAEALERARRDAEEKARRDAEEKARRDAEARARAEIEAAVKREADERALREIQERTRREEAEKAKRDAEARAKLEAEQRVKREAEDRIRRELEERARREIEERMRREEAERRRREEEERTRREAEEQARRKREEEERGRRELERQAAIEAEARSRVEAELRAKRESEERARRDDEDRHRKRADEEARKHREAEEGEALARSVREERERAEREAAEQKQLEEDERAARHEEKGERREDEDGRREEKGERREEESGRREEEEERRAEEEEQRREEEERQAKEEKKRAREEEKAQAKAAAKQRKAARSRERAGEEAWRGDEEALRDSGDSLSAAEVWEKRRPRSLARALAVLLLVSLVVGIAVLPFVPLETAAYEKAAQAWLGQPVKIGSMNLTLLPLPQLKFEKVVIGRDPQMRVALIKANPELGTLLDDRITLRSLELTNVTLPREFLAVLLQDKGGRRNLGVQRITAKGLKFESQNLGLPPLDLDAFLSADGALKSASFSNSAEQLSVKVEPRGGKAAIEISAAALPLPIGVDFGLTDFQAKGTATGSELALSSVEGRAFGGRLIGNARLRWSSGWSLEGEVTARQMEAAKVAGPLIGGGTLLGKGTYSMKGLLPERMALNSKFEGNFTIQKGTISNVDMTRLLQGSGSGGGTTIFSELSGSFSADPNQLLVRNIRLAAGLLTGAGQLDMDLQKNLSGRMQIELRAQSVQARSTLGVTGTLTNPQFRRSN